jgi:hypothetical protein
LNFNLKNVGIAAKSTEKGYSYCRSCLEKTKGLFLILLNPWFGNPEYGGHGVQHLAVPHPQKMVYNGNQKVFKSFYFLPVKTLFFCIYSGSL